MSKARDIADLDFNSPDIDGGNIDGATIGGTTPAAGTFTTLNTTGGINAGGQNVSNMNNATAVSFLSTNGYWVGGTQRMNGSGDLINIGDIGASGNVTSTAQEPTFTAICSDSSLTANQYIGGFKFQKTDPSGAGAGVLGGIRMRAEDSVGANAYMQFSTGWSGGMDEERARFTSEGSFLVGTTSSRPAEFSHPDGFSVRADVKGQIQNTVTDAQNAILNRDGSDGQLLLLRREGAEVGNIRSISSDSIAIGTGDAGLRFVNGTNRIQPVDMDSGLNSDALTSLGDTNKRFKDFHMSGDANIGGALNVTGLTTSSELNTSKILMKDGSTTTGGLFHEKHITGAGVSTDVSLFAETGRDIHFMSQGSANIKATVDNFGISAGKLYAVNQETNRFNGANANSYSTSTNLGYSQNNGFHATSGEKLVGTCNIRAYTNYAHFKTNLTANSQMFYFRVKGYFYGYGMNEAVIGGYTHSNNSILNVSTQTVYRANNNFNLHVYRAPDGGLVLRIQVGHLGYTEGLAFISFSNHADSTTSSTVILDAIHRDDGNNAY